MAMATLSSPSVFGQAKTGTTSGTTTDTSLVVPAAVAQSARLAVQKLGDKVIKGDFLYAYNTMYPRYRKRQEALFGVAKLKQVFVDMPNKLNQNAIVINKFIANQPTGFFQVWPIIKPEAKLKIKRGEQDSPKPNEIQYHWMVLVPTSQVWSFMKNKNGKVRKLLRQGFQVAVAKVEAIPGQEKWTFVDGATLKPQQLRSLFPSLAPDLKLPVVKDSEIK